MYITADRHWAFLLGTSAGWAGTTTTRPRNNIPLAEHWIPLAIPLLPGKHRNDQFEFIIVFLLEQVTHPIAQPPHIFLR